MGIALDYTHRIDPAALRAAGATDVLRYLKPDSAPEYRITAAEYRELQAAGIGVTLNWEFRATDWLGGATAGTAHAGLAVAQARALGYPAGCVIVGSADFDMTSTQWSSAGRAYARAFKTGLQLGLYRFGVYGPWDVLGWCRDEVPADMYWQARMSWAFSQGRNAHDWPGAHLIQRRHLTVAGQDTDQNDIIRPNWGQAGGGADMLADERNALFHLVDMLEWVDRRVAADSESRTGYQDVAKVPHVQGTVVDRQRLEQKVDALASKVDALAAGQVPVPSLVEALKDPGVLAALASAVNADAARRLAE